jgi:hypothetical protein
LGKLPAYRRHKATGQAVVTLGGKDYYLGPRKSVASRNEYQRVTRSGWSAAAFMRLSTCQLLNCSPHSGSTQRATTSATMAIYEGDLLVLTKQRFWLVEIKSWPGKVVVMWRRALARTTANDHRRQPGSSRLRGHPPSEIR